MNIPALTIAIALAAALAHAAPARAAQAAGIAERRPVDDIIYFLLPDRFANGNPANDHGGLGGGPDEHGFDPAHKGYYHGGDIAGMIDKLDYLEGLGVTAIWIAPIFKNRPVQGAPGARSAGYHGYWITDFTRPDPHFGEAAEFERLVEAAHGRGMKVIMDIVTNHTADVIRYRECEDCPYRSITEYPWTTRGARDGAPINPGFPGDAPEHRRAEAFARLVDPSWAYTPWVPEPLRGVKVPAWLNDPILYHNRGNSTFEGESSLYGDFAGLDDLFTAHPRVLRGMLDIYKDWIGRFRIDGFRIDTARHVDDAFWRAFLPEILAHARSEGIDDFYVFGEVYDVDPAALSRFTRKAAFPAVLDFAFQDAVRAVVAEGAPTRRLTELFARDHLYPDAGLLPTFLGNHDMGRIGHALLKARGELADDAELLARRRLADALLLFSRGVPVVYYGDEQGFTGDGGDQDAREDMFESRVDSYNDNRLIGTMRSTASDNFDPAHPLYRSFAEMARLFHAHPALRRGEQIVRHAEDDPGIFAFSRIDPGDGREYLVALNTASETRCVETAAGSRALRGWKVLTAGDTDGSLTPDGATRLCLGRLSWTLLAEQRDGD